MDKVDSISFGAIPINPVKIKKYSKKAKDYLPYAANFVQIDSSNKYDIKAINAVAGKWQNAKYVQKIATAANWMNEKNFSHIKIYAITSQKKHLDKLRYKNILGLVEMRYGSSPLMDYELCRMQVRPDAINVNNKSRSTFKKTGTSMLKSLKKIYSDITVQSEDNPNIEAFYEWSSFIRDYRSDENYFSWSSNIYKRTKLKINKFIYEHGLFI